MEKPVLLGTKINLPLEMSISSQDITSDIQEKKEFLNQMSTKSNGQMHFF